MAIDEPKNTREVIFWRIVCGSVIMKKVKIRKDGVYHFKKEYPKPSCVKKV